MRLKHYFKRFSLAPYALAVSCHSEPLGERIQLMLKSMSKKYRLKSFKNFSIIHENKIKSWIATRSLAMTLRRFGLLSQHYNVVKKSIDRFRVKHGMTKNINYYRNFLCHSEQSEESISKVLLSNKDSSVTSFPQNDEKRAAFTLAEVFSSHPTCQRKCAFTLAEVLITLGIIGVVAAMTMPVLINGHKHKVYEAQFKAAHSLISQAVLQMGNDNIDLNMYYCGNGLRNDASTYAFIKDFSKYFQVVKSVYGDTGSLHKLGYRDAYFFQSAPGRYRFNQDSHNAGAIIIKNGMMIASSGCWWYSSYIDFVVDTNGTKGPNKFGYDVFYFQIGPDNRLYPSSGDYSYAVTDAQRLACCNFETANTCSVPVDTGVSCAQYAMRNTYPHDEKKTYWDNLP